MQGMQEIAAGDAAYFHGLQCRVTRTEPGGGLCLALVGQSDAAWLMPLFLQDVCRIETAAGVLACLAEVAERYHCENQYRLRLLVKSGFYRDGGRTVQTRDCRIEAQLAAGQADGLPVLVRSISAEGAYVTLSGETDGADLSSDDDACEAVLKVAGLSLPGALHAGEDGADAYWFQIEGAEEKTLRALLENVVFGEKAE